MEQGAVLKEYYDSFKGLWKLPAKHHVHVDETGKSVVHAPRKIPVALRDKLKTELTQLETESVIAKVVEPTPWVSSLIIVPKSHG